MIDFDYHNRAMRQMCAVGRVLRAQALRQAACIRSAAWARDGVTPHQRAEMLALARDANAAGYSAAFAAWQEHYASCPICQEALRP